MATKTGGKVKAQPTKLYGVGGSYNGYFQIWNTAKSKAGLKQIIAKNGYSKGNVFEITNIGGFHTELKLKK